MIKPIAPLALSDSPRGCVRFALFCCTSHSEAQNVGGLLIQECEAPLEVVVGRDEVEHRLLGVERRQVAPPAEGLRFREPIVGLVNAMARRSIVSSAILRARVPGDSFLQFRPEQVGCRSGPLRRGLLAFQSSASRHSPAQVDRVHDRFGSFARSMTLLVTLASSSSQVACARSNAVLVDLRSRWSRIRASSLTWNGSARYCLLVDSLECSDLQLGELADVVREARFGDWDRNVVSEALPEWAR